MTNKLKIYHIYAFSGVKNGCFGKILLYELLKLGVFKKISKISKKRAFFLFQILKGLLGQTLPEKHKKNTFSPEKK